jgi:hypothetical protein
MKKELAWNDLYVVADDDDQVFLVYTTDEV